MRQPTIQGVKNRRVSRKSAAVASSDQIWTVIHGYTAYDSKVPVSSAYKENFPSAEISIA